MLLPKVKIEAKNSGNHKNNCLGKTLYMQLIQGYIKCFQQFFSSLHDHFWET